jgi:hypothetical protein
MGEVVWRLQLLNEVKKSTSTELQRRLVLKIRCPEIGVRVRVSPSAPLLQGNGLLNELLAPTPYRHGGVNHSRFYDSF